MAYIDESILPLDFITLPPDHFDNDVFKYIPIDPIMQQQFIYASIKESATSIFIFIYELISLIPIVRNMQINNKTLSTKFIVSDNLTEIEVVIMLYDSKHIAGYTVDYGKNIYIIELVFIDGNYEKYIDACEYIEGVLLGNKDLCKISN